MRPPRLFLLTCAASIASTTALAYPLTSRSARKRPTKSLAEAAAASDRRAFFPFIPACAAAAATLVVVPVAHADTAAATATALVKVTPLAHTFVVSSGKVKPIRENDVTRIIANARIVVSFRGSSSDDPDPPAPLSSFGAVVDLVEKRKTAQGAGVTPGTVTILTTVAGASSQPSPASIAEAASALPEGCALVVPPTKSGGTAADGRFLEQVAKAAGGLEVGGSRGGGVLGVLLNGPRDPYPIYVAEGGYEAPTVLWYDL